MFWTHAKVKVTTRTVGDVVVLDITGSIIPGEDYYDVLDGVIKDLYHQGNRKQLLNLEDIKELDLRSIGRLKYLADSLFKEQGELKACRLPSRIKDVTVRSSMANALKLHDWEVDAIRTFV